MTHFLRTSLSFFIGTIIFSQTVFSQNRMLLDESQNDWENVNAAWTAESSSGGISLQSFKVTNDDQFLFIYFKSDNMYSLQNTDGVTLYLDSDNSTSTGFNKDNIGAEIVFNLGQRKGIAYLNNSQQNIAFSDLFMVTTPTVDSDWFELQ